MEHSKKYGILAWRKLKPKRICYVRKQGSGCGRKAKMLDGKIGLMLYDTITFYFETSDTDTLRELGFPKDGKTADSQVILGLLVSEVGYPHTYSLYNGK